MVKSSSSSSLPSDDFTIREITDVDCSTIASVTALSQGVPELVRVARDRSGKPYPASITSKSRNFRVFQ